MRKLLAAITIVAASALTATLTVSVWLQICLVLFLINPFLILLCLGPFAVLLPVDFTTFL